MEVLSPTKSSIYNPFPHRDPYGLDSMYISPLQEGEIWNLHSFHKAEILSLSFLALRSCAQERLGIEGLKIIGTSLELRKSLTKKQWDLTRLPASWKSLIPSLITETELDKPPFPLNLEISLRVDWNDGTEEAGWGFLSENACEVFPKILDSLIQYSAERKRVYLRTSRQSFLYIPNLGKEEKKGLFIQDKESYGFPEFYYYWISG